VARDVDALPDAALPSDARIRGGAPGPVGQRVAASDGRGKRQGWVVRSLRALAALVAVLLVLALLGGFALYQRLQQGPLSLQPLASWVEGPVEQRLGRPVEIEGLTLARGPADSGGWVLSASPVLIGGDAPARAERLSLQFALPFELVDADLRVVDTDAPTLLAAWPPGLLPDVRDVLRDIIRAGKIRTGTLNYRFVESGPPDLQLQVDAEQVAAQLPNGLPVVTAPKADIRIEDGTLRITGPSATGADLTAERVEVTIDHITDPLPSHLRFSGHARGSAHALYRLLAGPPLRIIPGDLVGADGLHGRVDGQVRLGIPLVDQISPDAVDLEVDAHFREVSAVLHLPITLPLTATTGSFSAHNGAIVASGEAKLYDNPLSFELHDRWHGPQEERRLALKGPVGREFLDRFGIAMPDMLQGTALVAGRLRQDRHDVWHADIDADLAELGIREETIGLDKPVGQPGRLTLAAWFDGAADWAIEQFALDAGAQRAKGSLATAEGGRLLHLDELALPGTSLGADLLLAADGGISGRVAGQRLRLPKGSAGAAGAPAGQSGSSAPLPLKLEIAIDQVELEDGSLTKLAGHVQRGADGFEDVRLDFDLGGPGSLAITPATMAGRHRLELQAADAGRLLAGLGISDAISGGSLKIAADLSRQVPDLQASGRVDLGPTTIRMSGQDPLPFHKIVLPFQIDGPKLRIDRARMTGGPVGIRVSGSLDRQTRALDMSGEVTPLYPLNRFIGQIPIIGTILGGTRGLGAINADFTLTGTLDNPQARLAASSVLVPGVVRDLLRSIRPR
jgi:hypothetical protein